jgi:hypothetical protein
MNDSTWTPLSEIGLVRGDDKLCHSGHSQISQVMMQNDMTLCKQTWAADAAFYDNANFSPINYKSKQITEIQFKKSK